MLIRYLLVTLFCLMCATGSVSAAELKEVVATLEQGYQSLTDVQARFSQRSSIAGINREQKGGGEFAIRKGSGRAMFRFTYTKPQKQEIICNGKMVWLYVPENKQVMEMDTEKLFAGGSGIAITYLTGLGQVSRDFSITFAKERQDKKGNYVLELIPKQASPVLAKLILTISGSAVEKFIAGGKAVEPYPVVASTVIDSGDNRTSMEFSDIRTNQGVAASRFTFKVPVGVDVIKQ